MLDGIRSPASFRLPFTNDGGVLTADYFRVWSVTTIIVQYRSTLKSSMYGYYTFPSYNVIISNGFQIHAVGNNSKYQVKGRMSSQRTNVKSEDECQVRGRMSSQRTNVKSDDECLNRKEQFPNPRSWKWRQGSSERIRVKSILNHAYWVALVGLPYLQDHEGQQQE